MKERFRWKFERVLILTFISMSFSVETWCTGHNCGAGNKNNEMLIRIPYTKEIPYNNVKESEMTMETEWSSITRECWCSSSASLANASLANTRRSQSSLPKNIWSSAPEVNTPNDLIGTKFSSRPLYFHCVFLLEFPSLRFLLEWSARLSGLPPRDIHNQRRRGTIASNYVQMYGETRLSLGWRFQSNIVMLKNDWRFVSACFLHYRSQQHLRRETFPAETP